MQLGIVYLLELPVMFFNHSFCQHLHDYINVRSPRQCPIFVPDGSILDLTINLSIEEFGRNCSELEARQKT
jgi:hypothetical protein